MKVSEANGTTIRSRTTTELDALGNVIKVTEDKGGTAGSVTSEYTYDVGKRLVAVVGAGHVGGIKQQIATDHSRLLQEIVTVPPVSRGWKTAGWLVPLIIISSLGLIAYQKGLATAGENVMFWILANGIPAAIGSALALGHPVTTISAFASAPVTSLTPVIGAGYVTAFIQVMSRPPVVHEFESVADDMAKLTGWWRNKLLRVFLVFILTSFGSAIGTYVGGYEIITTLLG
jgi:pheromone shutdown protein TraB